MRLLPGSGVFSTPGNGSEAADMEGLVGLPLMLLMLLLLLAEVIV